MPRNALGTLSLYCTEAKSAFCSVLGHVQLYLVVLGCTSKGARGLGVMRTAGQRTRRGKHLDITQQRQASHSVPPHRSMLDQSFSRAFHAEHSDYGAVGLTRIESVVSQSVPIWASSTKGAATPVTDSVRFSFPDSLPAIFAIRTFNLSKRRIRRSKQKKATLRCRERKPNLGSRFAMPYRGMLLEGRATYAIARDRL